MSVVRKISTVEREARFEALRVALRRVEHELNQPQVTSQNISDVLRIVRGALKADAEKAKA